MVVTEFHPLEAANQERQTWEPEMNAWLEDYLAAQSDCSCVPLLRLGSVLDDQGQVVHVLAVLYHDPTSCSVRAEPVETLVGAELPAWAR
jgi:hypothetical protein